MLTCKLEKLCPMNHTSSKTSYPNPVSMLAEVFLIDF